MRDYEELVRCLRGHSKKMGCADNCICEDADERGFGTCSEELAKLAADAIEELCKPKWISVEERLPEKGTVVLAFGTRSATTGQFQGVGTAPWFWWWKGHTIKRVTHWMPLPKPPKESTNDSR